MPKTGKFKEKDLVQDKETGETLVVSEVADCSIMLGHEMYYCENKGCEGSWYLDDELRPAGGAING